MSKYLPPRNILGHLLWCCSGFFVVGLFVSWIISYGQHEYTKEPVLLGQYEVRCGDQPVIVTQLWQQGTRNYYLTNGRIVQTYDTDQCKIEVQRANLPR